MHVIGLGHEYKSTSFLFNLPLHFPAALPQDLQASLDAVHSRGRRRARRRLLLATSAPARDRLEVDVVSLVARCVDGEGHERMRRARLEGSQVKIGAFEGTDEDVFIQNHNFFGGCKRHDDEIGQCMSSEPSPGFII